MCVQMGHGGRCRMVEGIAGRSEVGPVLLIVVHVRDCKVGSSMMRERCLGELRWRVVHMDRLGWVVEVRVTQ